MKPFSILWLLASLTLSAQQPTQLVRSESRPITETTLEDPELAKVIEPCKVELKATFGEVLVEAPQALLRGRGQDENLLGYWVADLMRQRAEALLGTPVKFAVTNAGGIRANLRPGPVKIGDIYEVMPFENELVVVEFTGAELVQIIKEGIQRRAGEPCSGIKASVSGSPEKPEFTITWADGSAIDPKEKVKVATSDYLASSGDGTATIRQGRNLFTTGLPLRQLLLDACAELGKAKKTLNPPTGGRFKLTPEIFEAIKSRKLIL